MSRNQNESLPALTSWRVSDHGGDKRHREFAIMMDSGGVDGTGGKVASVYAGFGHHFTWEEAEGHAWLIAAAPESLAKIVASCKSFQAKFKNWLAAAYANDDYESIQAGRDFWLTRNRHGAGYWDREALDRDEIGKYLTEAAHQAGESSAYVGDDGLIYLSP